VVSGPYVLKEYDGVTCHFEINPYFKGAWMDNNLPGMDVIWGKAREHGQIVQDLDEFGNPVLDSNGKEIELVKPSIEKIAFTVADNDTMIGELQEEKLHLVNKVTYSPTIMKGMQSGLQYSNYPRIGLSFLTFSYDWPTVNEMEVRQAIAWCMDRDKLVRDYCGSFGLRMDGYFGMEQWEYQLVTGQIGYPVNFLSELDALGTRVEEEDEDLERYRKMTNMWVETQEDYERAIAAWDFLKTRWDDGEGHKLLTEYMVDLDQANKLLDKAKWNLNRNGEPYQAGVDDVRCKEIDGKIVPLDLKMMYPAGNHMAEFMLTDKDTWTLNQDGGEFNQFNPDEIRCKEINGKLVHLDINEFYTEDGQLADFLPEENSFVWNLAQVGIKLTLVPAPMQDLLHSYYRETERTTDMIYLATNFHVVVDPSITYSIEDVDTLGHAVWNNTYSDDEELYKLAVSMRQTEPGDIYGYVSKWMDFQDRYNEVLPTIPIYSNIYFDFYNEYLQNYEITAQVTWTQAILLAYFGLAEEAPAEDAEAADGEEFFE
jgi:ABC-type transport system substrate-binding protein